MTVMIFVLMIITMMRNGDMLNDFHDHSAFLISAVNLSTNIYNMTLTVIFFDFYNGISNEQSITMQFMYTIF